MVHLSSVPPLDSPSGSEFSEKMRDEKMPESPREESPLALSSLQLALAASASTYQGYETYIEDGVICLKHKIRNIEKKKLKLENYRKRLMNGETLNPDQLEAVEKYEEVVHNLKFARELQKTIDALSQDLLKAQRKTVRKEQVARMEAEKRRLSTVLHIQHILQKLQQEHVRKDLRSGLNRAPFLSAQELDCLLELSGLLGCRRDESMSLQDQMEQVSVVYCDLLEGRDKPVAGTTYKSMKEQLARLMDCGYFDHIPVPYSEKLEEAEVLVGNVGGTSKQRSSSGLANLMTISETSAKESSYRNADKNQALSQNWKMDFLTQKQEPPDSWEMKFMEAPAPPLPVAQKTLSGVTGFTSKKQILDEIALEPKQAQKHEKLTEIFSSLPSLPEDSGERGQQLQDLVEQIQGAFIFLQESMLDSECLLPNRHSHLSLPADGSSHVAVQSEERSEGNHLPKPLNEKVQLCECDGSSSPRYQKELSVSLTDSAIHQAPVSEESEQPAGKAVALSGHVQREALTSHSSSSALDMDNSGTFTSTHAAFNANAPLQPRSESDSKSDTAVLSDSYSLNYTTASTQTTSDTNVQEFDSLQPVPTYLSECPITNGWNVHLSPGQPVGPLSRHAQMYYGRGSAKGNLQCYRNGLRSPGSSCIRPHTPELYRVQETTYQMTSSHGASVQRNNSSASWSNSSQVSSPERDHDAVSADSGRSLSRCTIPVNMAVSSHGLVPRQMRVAFSAARTANFAPGSLDQTIIFDMLHCNLGEAFDVQTGRFYCPVNGTYAFIFNVLKLAVNVPLYINLMRNAEVMVSAYANDCAPDHETASNHAVLQLYQGDQVWLRLHRGAIYSSSWKYSTFSGHLLYQD